MIFRAKNWRRPNPFPHGWCQSKQLLQFNLKFILLPCLKDEEERPVSVSTPKATRNVNDPAALVCFYLRFRFWQPDSRRKTSLSESFSTLRRCLKMSISFSMPNRKLLLLYFYHRGMPIMSQHATRRTKLTVTTC